MRTDQHPKHTQLKSLISRNQWNEALQLISMSDDPVLYWLIDYVHTTIKSPKTQNTFHPATYSLIDGDFNLVLRAAAGNGLEKLVEILLTYKGELPIDVNAPGNPSGLTALDRATTHGHARIIALLIEHGAQKEDAVLVATSEEEDEDYDMLSDRGEIEAEIAARR